MKKMILAAAAFATMIGSASTGAMAASEQSKDPMMILGKKNTEATAATAITSEPAPPPVSTATMATAPEQVNLVTLQSQEVPPTFFQAVRTKFNAVVGYFLGN